MISVCYRAHPQTKKNASRVFSSLHDKLYNSHLNSYPSVMYGRPALSLFKFKSFLMEQVSPLTFRGYV